MFHVLFSSNSYRGISRNLSHLFYNFLRWFIRELHPRFFLGFLQKFPLGFFHEFSSEIPKNVSISPGTLSRIPFEITSGILSEISPGWDLREFFRNLLRVSKSSEFFHEVLLRFLKMVPSGIPPGTISKIPFEITSGTLTWGPFWDFSRQDLRESSRNFFSLL